MDEKVENQQDEDKDSSKKDSSRKKDKKPARDPWILWTRDIIICLIIVLLFRANVAEANYIPSPSMEPTLHVSDRIIVDKLSLRWRPLERGELVVFHPPLENRQGERWIKRVIGLPGETVEILNGKVYIDGELLDEDYIENPASYTVPLVQLSEDDPSTSRNEGEYFLLGDNRRNSRDSHVWGSCPAPNIIGRAVFRYWPLFSIGILSNHEP
jgi:signal peptidase I